LDVLYEKDYSRLIIEGSVPEETLKEAWRVIYAQYCELSQEGTYNELLDKTMEWQTLNGRIACLEGIILQLQWNYDPLLIRIVNEMAIPLQLSAEEDPYKKLKQVQGRVKRMLFDLSKIDKEIEAIQQTHQKENGIDQFEDWLSMMSKSYQYPVKAKDISVFQFIRNQKQLQQQFLKQKDGH
jgi:F0F1-type ATP synthase delta subunit